MHCYAQPPIWEEGEGQMHGQIDRTKLTVTKSISSCVNGRRRYFFGVWLNSNTTFLWADFDEDDFTGWESFACVSPVPRRSSSCIGLRMATYSYSRYRTRTERVPHRTENGSSVLVDWVNATTNEQRFVAVSSRSSILLGRFLSLLPFDFDTDGGKLSISKSRSKPSLDLTNRHNANRYSRSNQ